MWGGVRQSNSRATQTMSSLHSPDSGSPAHFQKIVPLCAKVCHKASPLNPKLAKLCGLFCSMVAIVTESPQSFGETRRNPKNVQ